jgi:hypothetical protein
MDLRVVMLLSFVLSTARAGVLEQSKDRERARAEHKASSVDARKKISSPSEISNVSSGLQTLATNWTKLGNPGPNVLKHFTAVIYECS